MGNPWLARPRFAWAHQGGAAEAPSNTLYAMERALALGADGTELDVHRTSDGELVVLHDARVDRTTDGHGRVAEMTLAEVQKLDAAVAWPHLRDRAPAADLRIPTFDEVLDRIPGPLTVEVKGAAAADDVLAKLRQRGRTVDTIVTSFSDSVVRRLRSAGGDDLALAPGRLWNLWFLVRCLVRLPPRRSRFVAAQLPYSYKGIPVLNQRVVEAAHRAGLAVHAWTIDDPALMVKLLSMGVDGIMTDRPTVLEEVLHGRTS